MDLGIFRSFSKCHGQACSWSISRRGYIWDELHRVHCEPRRCGLLCAHPVTGEPGEQCENHNDTEPWQRPAARRSDRPQQEVRTYSHTRIKAPWPINHVFLKRPSFCALRDNLVLTKSRSTEFRFRLTGVQLSDRGYYWCDITAWTKQQPGQAWTKVTSAESNKIRIDFQENGGPEELSKFLFRPSLESVHVIFTLSEMWLWRWTMALTADQEGVLERTWQILKFLPAFLWPDPFRVLLSV